MPERPPNHPTVVFYISPIYNLFHYLQTLTGKALSQPAALRQALEETMALRGYSPGSGLWGYFEEAFAASQEIDDLEAHLAAACQHLQTALLSLAGEATPWFEDEWQRRRVCLVRRREELADAWYPKEAELMQVIEDTFATPWEGPDAERIGVHLLYDSAHAAKSRPLTIGVNDQPLALLLCDIVHELLHRNTFGSARSGLWARLRLYYFSAGVSAGLGQEVTHAVITWAACAIGAQVWGLSFDQVYGSFYQETASPRPGSLDVMAELWPAYQAGELKLLAFVQQAVSRIGETNNNAPEGKEVC